MKCAYHPDRIALGYCSSCGKPLCTACIIRTSAGNYCQACATKSDRPPRARRAVPWWAIALAVLGILIIARALVHPH